MILSILIIVLFLIAIWFTPIFKHDSVSKEWITIAFIVKLLAGIFFVWMFSQYYSDKSKQDVYIYYNNGLLLNEATKENPSFFIDMLLHTESSNPKLQSYFTKTSRWGTEKGKAVFSDTANTSRIVGVLCILTNGNFYSVSFVSLMLAFIGLWWIFTFFSFYQKKASSLLFLILFFLPSAVFFTSGISKEAYVVFLIGLILTLAKNIKLNFKSIIQIGLILVAAFILIKIRSIYLMFFIVPFLLFWLFNTLQKYKSNYRFIFLSIILVGIILLSFWQLNSLADLLVEKRSDFIALASSLPKSNQIIEFTLEPTIASFVFSAPIALFNSLCVPYWILNNVLISATFIENILVLILLIWLILRVNFKDIKLPIFIFSFSLGIIGLLGVGWTTTIVGAIVRYRIVGLLFLLIALAIVSNPSEKLNKIIKYKNKLCQK